MLKKLIFAALILVSCYPSPAPAPLYEPAKKFMLLPVMSNYQVPHEGYGIVSGPHNQPPTCKFGAGIPTPAKTNYQSLAVAGICTTMDWGAFVSSGEKAMTASIKNYPMQWGGSINRQRLVAYAVAFPGSTWLMFNECDLLEQCNRTPTQAAVTYYETRKIIISIDPTARFACCGEAFGRHSWTDAFYQEYIKQYGEPPQIDAMHMHVYEQFARPGQVPNWDYEAWANRFDWTRMRDIYKKWRAWQVSRPQFAGLPVIVSETAVLTGAWWDKDPNVKGCGAKYKTEAEREARCIVANLLPWLIDQPEIEVVLWFSSWLNSDSQFGPSNVCVNNDCNVLTVVGERIKIESYKHRSSRNQGILVGE